ncbi:hypothetical protein CPSG_04419 [Coccidioides posadasii str. Silveira]|uniref:Uncharacterized protein n=1 Tax=Coccidioides posadasii (strain RMSCC 757 / Silveira) TaxID=443226 RepID=E9D480_COCPS|nr:hypothetical protein CPSG_04419 [Coccidioides posadasii str. Silveira]
MVNNSISLKATVASPRGYRYLSLTTLSIHGDWNLPADILYTSHGYPWMPVLYMGRNHCVKKEDLCCSVLSTQTLSPAIYPWASDHPPIIHIPVPREAGNSGAFGTALLRFDSRVAGAEVGLWSLLLVSCFYQRS